jgi:hypothetical protein
MFPATFPTLIFPRLTLILERRTLSLPLEGIGCQQLLLKTTIAELWRYRTHSKQTFHCLITKVSHRTGQQTPNLPFTQLTSIFSVPTTVYGDIVVSGRNAEVCNGDESTNHHSNNYSYIPLRNINVGSEFKYIKVISGIVHNGETGVANASKYDRIEIKAPDSGDAKALVKNGRFESVELQRSWFEEMRDLEERAKERERQRKREEESTRGRMRDLIPRRGRREGDLINSGRAMGLDFLE